MAEEMKHKGLDVTLTTKKHELIVDVDLNDVACYAGVVWFDPRFYVDMNKSEPRYWASVWSTSRETLVDIDAYPTKEEAVGKVVEAYKEENDDNRSQ